MKNIYYTFILLAFSIVSCNKFLDRPLTDRISEDVISSGNIDQFLPSLYYGASNSLFNKALGTGMTSYKHFLLITECLGNGDMVTLNVSGAPNFYTSYNFFHTDNIESGISLALRTFYLVISNCNVGIDKYKKTAGEKNLIAKISYAQLLMVRAFCYFDIVRFYQHHYEIGKDLPVAVIREGYTYDMETVNNGKPLSKVSEIYDYIMKDIEEALDIFEKNNNYVRPNKFIINKEVAYGIASRIYLTRGTLGGGGGIKEYMDKAVSYSSKARKGFTLMDTTKFKSGFNDINNSEWMLGYTSNNTDNSANTTPQIFRNLDTRLSDKDYPTSKCFLPDPYFKKIFSYDGSASLSSTNYDTGDIRYKLFEEPSLTGDPMILRNKLHYRKFIKKDITIYGDVVFMRSAEMYLIEAEAILRGGDMSLGSGKTAETLINELRTVRGAQITGYTVDLDFVLKERRRELWGEGILGTFEINRLRVPLQRKLYDPNDFSEYGSKIDGGHDVVNFADGSSFVKDSKYYLFQIPVLEIQNNPQVNEPLPRL